MLRIIVLGAGMVGRAIIMHEGYPSYPYSLREALCIC
jgi:hypothetical protein